MNRSLVWLADERATDASVTGGKGAGLARLLHHGHRIPTGFVLTTDAYSRSLTAHGVMQAIRGLSECMDDHSSRQRAGRVVRERIREASLSPEDARALEEAARRLCGSGPLFVAVRSSATVEDGRTASYAGVFQSTIGARGVAAIESAVLGCWASLFAPASIEYVATAGHRIERISIAVVIQLIVPATRSGVMMTADPRTGDRSQLVVEATVGLGLPLVSGEIDPDRFCIDKVTLDVRSVSVGAKHMIAEVEESAPSIVTRACSEELRGRPCLDGERLRELAEMGLRAERTLGAPQDLEWAWGRVGSQEGLFALQARPITARPRTGRVPRVLDGAGGRHPSADRIDRRGEAPGPRSAEWVARRPRGS